MKKILFSLSVMIFGSIAMNAQNVSVNTDGSTADASSILDVKSTTKGMLVPRMTTAQRTAIPTPANGLLVYDTDVKSFWYYNGTAWTNITGSGGAGQLTLPFEATVTSQTVPFYIRNAAGPSSAAIKAENWEGYGVTAITHTGTGMWGVAFDNGTGVHAETSSGIAVNAAGVSGNAIKATANGLKTTVDVLAINADAVYAKSEGASKAGIKGEASGAGGMGVYGTSTGTSGYGVRGFSGLGTGVHASTNTGHGIIASANTGVGIRTSSTSGNALEVFGKLKIYGNAVNPQNGSVLTSDAEGNATWKLNRVGFRARGTGSIADYSDIFPLSNIEYYDYSNSYNNSTGVFTAPVNGLYSFGAEMWFSLTNDIDDNIEKAQIFISVYRNGVQVSYYSLASPFATVNNGSDFSEANAAIYGDLRLQVGDVVRLRGFQDNTADASISWQGKFFGHLVFAD